MESMEISAAKIYILSSLHMQTAFFQRFITWPNYGRFEEGSKNTHLSHIHLPNTMSMLQHIKALAPSKENMSRIVLVWGNNASFLNFILRNDKPQLWKSFKQILPDIHNY